MAALTSAAASTSASTSSIQTEASPFVWKQVCKDQSQCDFREMTLFADGGEQPEEAWVWHIIRKGAHTELAHCQDGTDWPGPPPTDMLTTQKGAEVAALRLASQTTQKRVEVVALGLSTQTTQKHTAEKGVGVDAKISMSSGILLVPEHDLAMDIALPTDMSDDIRSVLIERCHEAKVDSLSLQWISSDSTELYFDTVFEAAKDLHVVAVYGICGMTDKKATGKKLTEPARNLYAQRVLQRSRIVGPVLCFGVDPSVDADDPPMVNLSLDQFRELINESQLTEADHALNASVTSTIPSTVNTVSVAVHGGGGGDSRGRGRSSGNSHRKRKRSDTIPSANRSTRRRSPRLLTKSNPNHSSRTTFVEN